MTKNTDPEWEELDAKFSFAIGLWIASILILLMAISALWVTGW